MTDNTLLARIKLAVAAANEAQQTMTTARAEHESRSREVGLLLLEAKKLHPAAKDFEAFLKKVDGLKLSRAYDLLRLAGGRTTDEELKRDARERQQKSRARKLPKPDSVTEPMSRNPPLPKAQPEPEPKPEPVTPAVSATTGPRPSWEDVIVDDLKVRIGELPYDAAHQLSLWLTDYLAEKKAA